MRYEEFVLQIGRSGDAYRVTARSPAGETSAETSFPFPPSSLNTLRSQWERWAAPPGPLQRSRQLIDPADASERTSGREELAKLGHSLFQTLFPQPILELLRETTGALGERREQRGGRVSLLIRLSFDTSDPELGWLSSVPWELLSRETASGPSPLALDDRTSLVRYLEVPGRVSRPRLVGALRVLVVLAAPEDRAPLDLIPEAGLIRRHWSQPAQSGRDIEIEVLQSANRHSLHDALRREPHVVHFMGHGGFSRIGGPSLVLEDEDEPLSDLLSARHLAELLSKHRPPSLVVLNACDTAAEDGASICRSVAGALVESGLPAVIGMQFPISDTAALLFGESLHRRLAEGGTLFEAVAEARLVVRTELPASHEWATPVVFARIGDGELFAPAEPAEREADRRQPRKIPMEPDIWVGEVEAKEQEVFGDLVVGNPPPEAMEHTRDRRPSRIAIEKIKTERQTTAQRGWRESMDSRTRSGVAGDSEPRQDR